MRSRNFSILAGAAAGINTLGLVIVAGLYFNRPTELQVLTEPVILGGLCALVVFYYGSLHQFLKQRHAGLSTFIISLISALNLALLIYQTGGLDSPFYAFWLLGIVAAGIFGTGYVIGTLALTSAATAAVFATHNFALSYMAPKLGQLLITLFAAGLAEWIYLREQDPSAAPTAASSPQQLGPDALMSYMTDGVVAVDNKGIIKLINRAAAEMTGWDVASATGLNYRSVIDLKTAHDEPLTAANDPFAWSFRTHTAITSSDLILYSRAGHKAELSLSVAPITDPAGQQTGAVVVFRDISHDKELERQRNEFVSTASHEMRTPVASIEGYISLALNPKVATVDDRARTYLTKAHDNTKHLGALFRDLLSVTKLEEGIATKHLVPVNVSQMLQEVISDMTLAAQTKHLTITYGAHGAGGDRSVMPIYYVLAEPDRLREVVTNLIDNAIKYTSEGGITVGLAADQKLVTVRITDTGPGIAPEHIPHLFQKFYRIDNSSTRTAGGTGLGLFLCRAIIELFSGRIWVESQLGKGSSFNFSLVRTEPTEPAAATVTPQPQPAVPIQVTPPAPQIVNPTNTPPAGRQARIDGIMASIK